MRIKSKEKFYRFSGNNIEDSMEEFYEHFTMPIQNFVVWKAYLAYDWLWNLPGLKQLDKFLTPPDDGSLEWMPRCCQRDIRAYFLGRRNRRVTHTV